MPLLHRSLIARLLSRRAWRTILGIFALIQVVFVTDIFTSELEAVIRYGGSVGDFLWLMLLKCPSVVDFALPIVLFLGLYIAIQGARTDNELVICAAAGEPWHQIPRTALSFGVGAMAVSLVFSGLIVPAANYTLRLSFHDLVARQFVSQLTEPQDRSVLREIDGRMVIATPTPGAERGRLLVYSGLGDDTDAWRAAMAQDWRVAEDGAGGYRLDMDGFREMRGGDAAGFSAAPGLALSQLAVETLSIDFRLDDVLEAADQGRQSGERFLFQAGGPLAFGDTAPTRALGEMLARALLSLVAAAVAVAAAAFAASRAGRFLALPVGLMAVLVADIGSRAILGDAADLGFARFWLAALALLALGLAPALGYIWLRAEALVTPIRGTAA